jgi:hypothetical protein
VPRIGTLTRDGRGHPGLLPLDGHGADGTEPNVSKRQILLFPARACNELTPPLHRTPPGPRAGSSLTPDPPQGRALLPEHGNSPGFDVIVEFFDASAVVQPCSSSRRTPNPLIAGLLRSRFPPRLLTGMTLRWFGISACTANPEGLPPSLAQHGSWWRSSTSSPLPFQDALPKIIPRVAADRESPWVS